MHNEELGHIGDGVYLSFDGWQYWLAVNHPGHKVVALEPDVLLQLNATVAYHREALTQKNEARMAERIG